MDVMLRPRRIPTPSSERSLLGDSLCSGCRGGSTGGRPGWVPGQDAPQAARAGHTRAHKGRTHARPACHCGRSRDSGAHTPQKQKTVNQVKPDPQSGFSETARCIISNLPSTSRGTRPSDTYREVPTGRRDPVPAPASRVVPTRPASTGSGRLEVPRRLRGSSQSRRWGPPGAPREAPFAAITFSPGTRTAAGASIPQGTVPLPCSSPLQTVHSGRALAVGEGTPPRAHAELGRRPPVTLGLPSPKEQQSVQPAPRVPGLHLQALLCNHSGRGQPRTSCARRADPCLSPHLGGHSPDTRPAVSEESSAEWGPGCRAVYLQVLGVSFLGKGLVLAGAPRVRGLLRCPSQKHLPSSGNLKFKQTATRREEGRGNGPGPS